MEDQRFLLSRGGLGLGRLRREDQREGDTRKEDPREGETPGSQPLWPFSVFFTISIDFPLISTAFPSISKIFHDEVAERSYGALVKARNLIFPIRT